VKVHHSALKHGVAPEDAAQAADWPLWVQPLEGDDWPHRELRLGFDSQARLLETVVLSFEGGEELVIHATPCQPVSSTGIFCPELSLGGSVHDPLDPVGRLLFNVLAMVAEFEADLIRMRTREGVRVAAKAKGRLHGRQPKLTAKQEAHLAVLVGTGEYTTLEVAELFGVGRSTVYRAVHRAGARAGASVRAEAVSTTGRALSR